MEFHRIPEAEYQPDLEDRVKYFVGVTPDLPKNTAKPKRAKMPQTTDPFEQEVWQREEIRRCREGHFGYSGKFYFWYNYCKIWDIERGTLFLPDFRVCQIEWFRQIHEVQESKEWGLICVKRRRIGASWLEAADVLHDVMFWNVGGFFKVGMTSKTEDDAKELFKKVKFIYDNLPLWMKPTTSAGNTATSLFFGWKEKDAKGNWQLKGLQSEIKVKAPTDTAWEGYGLRKFVVDEAGKAPALKQMFSYANDTMMVGNRRAGTPVIFGTAGDISKEGKDFKEMWYNADVYKLRQFFFGGWMGLAVDEFGNDLKEDAIRWIIYERKRLESLSQKEYNDFLQKYPLTVQEAFTSNESQGLGNVVKINKQLNSLYENPVKEKKGFFKLDANKKPIFVPSGRGKCIIYEDPDPVYQNLYLGGLDPTDAEVEEGRRDVSELALFIGKKRHGQDPPKIVFEYVDRPAVPRDFYDQALLACIYFNNTKLMVEKNKPGVITYFDEAGYKHLLATKPNSYERLVMNNTWNIGYYKDKKTTAYMEELVAEYIEDHSDIIPSKGLLEECINYGIINTDRVSAFMALMLLMKEDKWEAKQKTDKSNIPNWGYVRGAGGVPVRINRAKTKPFRGSLR